jgi:hypothetical protein
MKAPKIIWCTCEWCHGYPRDNINTVEELIEYVLGASGPFDEAQMPHTLALTLRSVLLCEVKS